MNVLIVENSISLKKILFNIVKKMGVKHENIYETSTESGAIGILLQFEIDLIILDWKPPFINPYELTIFVRNNTNLFKIPIIALAQDNVKENIEEIIDMDIDALVVKPFNLKSMKKNLGNYIKLY